VTLLIGLCLAQLGAQTPNSESGYAHLQLSAISSIHSKGTLSGMALIFYGSQSEPRDHRSGAYIEHRAYDDGTVRHQGDSRCLSGNGLDLARRRVLDQSRACQREGVSRVYRPTPPHYHATCDEFLYVFSGRGTFWAKDASTKAEFKPGQLLFFERGTVHAMPELFEHPVVFLSVGTPRREPTDIIFVDPSDGTPETFMARNAADSTE
jgi:mannose-6-phosphate isomerase-like protein (cupin superfamily)